MEILILVCAISVAAPDCQKTTAQDVFYAPPGDGSSCGDCLAGGLPLSAGFAGGPFGNAVFAGPEMRAAIASAGLETPRDGFLQVPTGPGLGIQVNESALEKYHAA